MKNADHPFFRPLWRRIALVAGCLAWAGFEFYNGSRNWGLIALAFAAYGAWEYLWVYKPPQDGPDQSLPKE